MLKVVGFKKVSGNLVCRELLSPDSPVPDNEAHMSSLLDFGNNFRDCRVKIEIEIEYFLRTFLVLLAYHGQKFIHESGRK